MGQFVGACVLLPLSKWHFWSTLFFVLLDFSLNFHRDLLFFIWITRSIKILSWAVFAFPVDLVVSPTLDDPPNIYRLNNSGWRQMAGDTSLNNAMFMS